MCDRDVKNSNELGASLPTSCREILINGHLKHRYRVCDLHTCICVEFLRLINQHVHHVYGLRNLRCIVRIRFIRAAAARFASSLCICIVHQCCECNIRIRRLRSECDDELYLYARAIRSCFEAQPRASFIDGTTRPTSIAEQGHMQICLLWR